MNETWIQVSEWVWASNGTGTISQASTVYVNPWIPDIWWTIKVTLVFTIVNVIAYQSLNRLWSILTDKGGES